MRKALLGTVLLAGLFFGACQKCAQCTAVDQNGQVLTQDEVCGTDQEIRAYEEDCQAQYSASGIDGSCSCQYQ